MMKPDLKSPVKKEKGQILVILALSLVAIFAFTGLAIDGNRIYHAKRLNQSTADSAALAGAGAAQQALLNSNYVVFSCGDGELGSASNAATLAAKEAAKNSAIADDINLSLYDLSTGNGVTVICDMDSMRVYLDIIVKVTTQTPTTFTHVINVDAVNTSASATVRFYPKQTAGYGNTLVSLAAGCSANHQGITFGNSSRTNILKGGIFSNSCISTVGSEPEVTIEDGKIIYNEDFYRSSWPGSIDPQPKTTTNRLDDDLIPPPTCPPTGSTAYVSAPNSSTLSPGNYKGISLSSDSLTLQRGLYCLDGDLKITGKSTFSAEGVTFYFASGAPDFSGTAVIHMSAPICESGNCPTIGVPPAIPGMLMYIGHTEAVKINGTADNYFEGLIYAPKSEVTLDGTSYDVNVIDGQVIGYGIIISGNAKLSMNQTGKNQYTYEATMDFMK